VISLTHRPLPDKTHRSQQTDFHAPAGFETVIALSESSLSVNIFTKIYYLRPNGTKITKTKIVRNKLMIFNNQTNTIIKNHPK